MPAIARRFRTFGADSRNSVAKTGASRISLVRAAAGRAARGLVARAGRNDAAELAMLRSLMALLPQRGLEQRLRRKRPQEPGGCIRARCASSSEAGPISPRRARPATHHFSGLHEIFSCF